MDSRVDSGADEVIAAICETARGLAAAGVLDESTLREFDDYCRASDSTDPTTIELDQIIQST